MHDWIEQLTGQGFLEKTGEYNVPVCHGGRPAGPQGRSHAAAAQAGREAERKSQGRQGGRRIPGRASTKDCSRPCARRGPRSPTRQACRRSSSSAMRALRDMARRRPSTVQRFLDVKGVGQTKADQYGRIMVERIRAYCIENALEMDLTIVD